MTCAITSCLRQQARFLEANFEPLIVDRIVGGAKVYLLHRVGAREADVRLCDPIDGMLLVEIRYFDDELTARQWIANDILRAPATGRAN